MPIYKKNGLRSLELSIEETSRMRNFNFRYYLIGVFALALLWSVHWKYNADIAQAKRLYIEESHTKTIQAAERVASAFNQIYQGLRTIARLPGVRSIDRHGNNFNPDAKQAVQEIYNNLASNVAMSEVYIVPKDLDPDVIDPATHQLQTPITTFDELILTKKDDSAEKAKEEPAVEEIEIYEYRLMKQQFVWFAKNTPSEKLVDGLNFPALTGPEVITCDNSRYSVKTPDDKNRSGLVYSVPFFAPDGTLKGSISGVILTRALQALIPEPYFAVRSIGNDYTFTPLKTGEWINWPGEIRSGAPSPRLIYSEVLPLKIVDSASEWKMWAGQPDELFWSRPDSKGAQQFAYACAMLIFLVAIALSILVRIGAKRNTLLKNVISELDGVSTNVTEGVDTLWGISDSLAGSAQEQAAAVQETVASMSEISGMIGQTASSARDSLSRANSVRHQTEEGSRIVEKMVSSMDAIKQANSRLNEIATVVREISQKTMIINDIVFKTQLLSFNASIEAARAGQHGRGFAVVAEEVGNLADMSGQASKEIEALLQNSQAQVDSVLRETETRVTEGQAVTSEVKDLFSTIASEVATITNQMTSVTEATQEQEMGVKQITVAATRVDEVAGKNNSLAARASKVVEELAKQTHALTQACSELSGLMRRASSESENAQRHDHYRNNPSANDDRPKNQGTTLEAIQHQGTIEKPFAYH